MSGSATFVRRHYFILILVAFCSALWLTPAVQAVPYCAEGERCEVCGDGTCGPNEGIDCPADCDPYYGSCGDGLCNGVEDCSGCPGDCGACSGGGGSAGDGHAWCDGWDRQGDCAFNHIGVAAGREFRRLRGGGGYQWQTFLTWHPAEFNGFGRFTVGDGSVGVISTSPEDGQVPLYRWSTRKGFYYSTNYGVYGSDYTYGGIAGYVWPAGTNKGYPLYQYYSHEYGHFYTNFPQERRCRPNVYWDDQGVIAHVNWPAPLAQAIACLAQACDPFAMLRCRSRGSIYNTGNCTCFDGLP